MSNKDVIISFFKDHLTPDIKRKIALHTIQDCTDAFIDGTLSTSFADKVYRVKFNNEALGYAYFLVEHQSRPDKWMALRSLKYKCGIMLNHVRMHGGDKLPVVIPMVLYNGKIPYNYNLDILGLFHVDSKTAKQFFFNPIQLINVKEISDDVLCNKGIHGPMEYVMKHAYDPDILLCLEKIMPNLHKLEEFDDGIYLSSLLKYVMTVGNIEDVDAFMGFIQMGFSKQVVEEMMTILQQVMQQGMLKGEAQGMLKGKDQLQSEVIQSMLKEGYNFESIAKVMHLDAIKIQAIINTEKK